MSELHPPAAPGSIVSRIVVPILGGLTTVATLATISAVFSAWSWIVGPAIAIAVVVLVGIGLRTLNLAAAYTTLLQLALGLLAILVFFVPSSMFAYVIPTLGAVGDLIDLITNGAATARSSPAPIAPNSGTSSLLALLAVPVAVIVDDAIAHARPAMIGIPLLSMYAICGAIVRAPISLWQAMAPLIGFILVLLVDRLAAHRRALSAALAGRSLVVAAALTALAIFVGASVSTAAQLPDGGFLNTGGGSERTPNDMVARTTDLSGQLTRDDPLDLFTVTTDDENPYYLRAVVLDTWGKDGWSFATPRDSGATAASLPDTASPAASVTTTATVEVQNYSDVFVPTYYRPTALTLGSDADLSYDITMQVLYGADKGMLTDNSYTVTSAVPKPTELELQAAPFAEAPDGVLARDLAAPSDVDSAVIALTQQVTAGAQTPWDVALALDAFFADPNGGWEYSFNVPDPKGNDPLASFLSLRVGFCEQYASAMASMFRLAGVPARVAVGYTNGELQPDSSRQITTDDAHAWVEAYFAGVGWVAFDPTPIGDRSVPLPYVPSDQIDPGSNAAPSSAATPTEQLAPSEANPVEPEPTQADDGARSTGIPSVLWWLLIALAAMAVLLAPAALRWHWWRSRRALAAAGGIRGAYAAWDELAGYATDLGYRPSARKTVRELEPVWRERFDLDSAALQTLLDNVERARYAEAPDIPALDEPLAALRHDMGTSVTTGRRLWARLRPISLLELLSPRGRRRK